MTEVKICDPSLALLNQLFTSATNNASAAMSQWTNGQITLTLDEVREIALEDISTELDIGEELLTMVVLNLEGDLGGQLIITFDEANGRKLAASLLERDVNTEPEWNELEQSALNETGNILACAYLKEVTSVIEQTIVPSPPHFFQDYGFSVLQQAVMPQALDSDRVLICRTIFQRQGEELNWNVFFVPTEALLELLQGSLQNVT